jgi:hypothetical protein
LKEHPVLVFANKAIRNVEEGKDMTQSKSLNAGGTVRRVINPEDSFKVNINFSS